MHLYHIVSTAEHSIGIYFSRQILICFYQVRGVKSRRFTVFAAHVGTHDCGEAGC